jgi:phosphoesterase family protein
LGSFRSRVSTAGACAAAAAAAHHQIGGASEMSTRSTIRLGVMLLVAIMSSGCAMIRVTTNIKSQSRLSSVDCHSAGAAAPGTWWFNKVLIIVIENQDYRDVIADPNFAALAKRGTSFTNFHGLFHPSYANYLSMVSGRSHWTVDDVQRNFDEKTIADTLKETHSPSGQALTWKNYAEGYPAGECFLGDTRSSERYARKHVPFLSFTSIQHSDECRLNVVPADMFRADRRDGRLPSYMLYSPDLDHDGHDPTSDPPIGLIKASRWLESFLEPLLKDEQFMHETLTVITFDESDAKWFPDDNHIYTVFLGDMVRPGTFDQSYNHYNVLRTIEVNFGLPPLADGDGCAQPIADVWSVAPHMPE